MGPAIFLQTKLIFGNFNIKLNFHSNQPNVKLTLNEKLSHQFVVNNSN